MLVYLIAILALVVLFASNVLRNAIADDKRRKAERTKRG